jgi:hypothetical protein
MRRFDIDYVLISMPFLLDNQRVQFFSIVAFINHLASRVSRVNRRVASSASSCNKAL